MKRGPAERGRLSFRAVNRRDSHGFEPGLQRHHLLPVQLVGTSGLNRLFDRLGRERIGFDDFRRNGLLLPAEEQAARLLGLPLHRGPHRQYNQMVMERVGTIEARWARESPKAADAALDEALFRLGVLQNALRRRLLSPPGRAMVLNRRDPAAAPAPDFEDLDAMAEMLWSATA